MAQPVIDPVKCPRCGTTDLRPQGVLVRDEFVSRRQFLWWKSAPEWTQRIVGADYCCGKADCGFVFTRLGMQVTEAPTQRLVDMLKEAQRIVDKARAESGTKEKKPDEKDVPVVFDADLNPDPRTQRRRR